MRILLNIVGVIAVLLIIDAVALHGQYRQTLWREAQGQASIYSYNLARMIRFAGAGR